MRNSKIHVNRDYQNNRLFDMDSPLNRDNCLFPYYLLKQKLKTFDIDLNTQDIATRNSTVFNLYLEMPSSLPKDSNNCYLILFETEVIKPDNWDFKKHSHFQKVFTWNDKYAGTSRYVKIQFPQNDFTEDFPSFAQRSKFLVIIAGNKSSKHPLELYSERKKVIRWYEKNHPEYFDLYGVGWDQLDASTSTILKILRKFNLLRFVPSSHYPSYLGKVESKLSCLQEYKFSLCFENARDIPGYLTEKLFDCFLAGCVPVYWGCPNLTDYVPKSCFIDYSKFHSLEDLHTFLVNMPEEEYQEIQNEILKFLKSPNYKQFSSNNFVNTIIEEIKF